MRRWNGSDLSIGAKRFAVARDAVLAGLLGKEIAETDFLVPVTHYQAHPELFLCEIIGPSLTEVFTRRDLN